jgi:prophage antirepressor-like protein
VLSTQIAITVIYTCNMFVLFCACDVMNVLSVKKKMKIYKKINKKKRKSKLKDRQYNGQRKKEILRSTKYYTEN